MTIDPLNPVFAVAILAVAALTGAMLLRIAPVLSGEGRVTALDGLRGYLALGVLIHHGAIWYFRLRGAPWERPPSTVFTQLGETGVALFFMISAFLFFTRVLNADSKKLDWTRLYVSRVLRLAPLYFVAMATLFLMVAIRSGFTRQESWGALIGHAMKWLAFSLPGMPDINQVPHTFEMMAGITWSLPYEWCFYAALPIMALALRRSVPMWLVLATVGFLAIVLRLNWLSAAALQVFIGGVLAAILVRSDRIRHLATTPSAGALALGLLAIVLVTQPTVYHPIALGLLSVSFTIMACGNGLFGLLTNKVARLLGELSYGLYLLQGIVLYVAFEWAIPGDAAALSPLAHWAIMVACVAVLIPLSLASFTFIEAPAMRHVPGLTAWTKSLPSAARLLATRATPAKPLPRPPLLNPAGKGADAIGAVQVLQPFRGDDG
jgi:peptidoglycan/LPS O-acetylase OafA/YrhL